MDTQTNHMLSRRADLDLGGRGYWVAAAIDATRPTGVKFYFDAKCHGGCPAWTLLDEICDVNNISDATIHALSDLSKGEEERASADLLGSVVQVRRGHLDGDAPQAKIYFRPVRREGIGIRQAAARVAAIARRHVGDERARRIRDEVIRRDSVFPTFYIAIALRPSLEIETYHDVQGHKSGSWSAADVERLVVNLTGEAPAARRALQISELARKGGFQCHHVSCDLLGGDRAISLFFDHLTWKRDVDGEFRDVLQSFCDLDSCATAMPRDKSGFRISSDLQPIIIGTKIDCDEVASFVVNIEEVELEVVDLI